MTHIDEQAARALTDAISRGQDPATKAGMRDGVHQMRQGFFKVRDELAAPVYLRPPLASTMRWMLVFFVRCGRAHGERSRPSP